MHARIKKLAMHIPALRRLVEERDRLREERDRWRVEGQREGLEHELDTMRAELNEVRAAQGFAPAGHFYSPVPDWGEIRRNESRIFGEPPRTLDDLELNEQEQLALLESFVPYYKELCFSAQPQDGLRYHYDNPAYSYSDAILLYCMIRQLRPARIIEIGSGYSSCMMMDTNELFFDNTIETTCIEPYPELLQSLLKPGDAGRMRLIPERAQEVDLEVFDALEANDILFIDSTHVSRIDSDVNRIVFDVLPRLARGVYVHFHDIFFPFEYPAEWVREGRAWNEAYLLRAFLQYNTEFRIVLMNTYMERFHEEFFRAHMPLCLENTGASIWLRRD